MTTPNLFIIICVDNLYSFISDLLWSLLCCHQPLQEVPNLHPSCHRCLQGQEEKWNATSYLLRCWQCLPWHVARSWESVNSHYVSQLLLATVYILCARWLAVNNVLLISSWTEESLVLERLRIRRKSSLTSPTLLQLARRRMKKKIRRDHWKTRLCRLTLYLRPMVTPRPPVTTTLPDS